MPRHARNHSIPPSEINYRANIECLKKLKIKNIISLSAVGSLREDYKPGDFVLVDQFIDKTYLRKNSFFEKGIVAHVPFSNPICENLTKISSNILKKEKINFHKSGTYICIEGPQFSTLAESRLYRSWGCDVIGMTNLPEAKLAKEAGICYMSVAMVTDYDCWHPNHDKVTVGQILKTLEENSQKAFRFISELSMIDKIKCPEKNHIDVKNAIVTNLNNVDKKILKKLKNIL